MNIVFLYRMRKLLLIGFCLISQGLFAQMSGSYTIGGTAGATNFAAWSDFTKALSTSGVSGNVSVTVMSNQTVTAAVQFDQNATNPTSSSKKIAIDGNGKSISGSLTYELMLFNGADFIEIKNLSITNSGTASSVLGVRFAGGFAVLRIGDIKIIRCINEIVFNCKTQIAIVPRTNLTCQRISCFHRS